MQCCSLDPVDPCVPGRRAGFHRLELAATLPGVPLYEAFGFREREHGAVPMPDGQALPIVIMERGIAGPDI